MVPTAGRIVIAVAVLTLVGSLLVVASASADTTFTVNTNADGNDASCTAGNCTLREAIDAANATAGLDTINFAPAVTGTIELNSILPVINSPTNLIGPGAENLNIHRSNNAPQFRIFHVTGSGNPVSISGLKVSNGRDISRPVSGVISGFGGGIYNSGNLVLDRVVVSDNHVFGTRVPGGFLTPVSAQGGGIFNFFGSLTVRRSVVEKNSASAFDTGNGVPSSVEVQGGGIYNYEGAVTIESTKISENTVSGLGDETDVHGGGVFNHTLYVGGGSGSAMTIANSLISKNASGNNLNGGSPGGGGGVANAGPTSTLTILSSTLSGNTADDFGGGIDTFDRALTALNAATIAGNTANNDRNNFGDGGGTWNGTDAPGGVAVGNTLYYDNHVGTGVTAFGIECAGFPHTSLGYNLRQSSDTGRCLGFTSTGDFIDAGVDVQPLADNGGLTFTHALTVGSLAVNAGNPAAPGSGGNACPATDQRGLYRGGSAGRCDIGAFELGATVTPPPTSGSTPASGSSATPPPAGTLATGQRAAALKKCKKKFKRTHNKRAFKKCKKKANLLPV